MSSNVWLRLFSWTAQSAICPAIPCMQAISPLASRFISLGQTSGRTRSFWTWSTRSFSCLENLEESCEISALFSRHFDVWSGRGYVAG